MNRPGTNATGVTVIAAELWPKQLELLRKLRVRQIWSRC
jgi:hypothetical protein